MCLLPCSVCPPLPSGTHHRELCLYKLFCPSCKGGPEAWWKAPRPGSLWTQIFLSRSPSILPLCAALGSVLGGELRVDRAVVKAVAGPRPLPSGGGKPKGGRWVVGEWDVVITRPQGIFLKASAEPSPGGRFRVFRS